MDVGFYMRDNIEKSIKFYRIAIQTFGHDEFY